MTRRLQVGMVLCLAAALTAEASAALPLMTPVQGVLRDNAGQPVQQGTFAMTFSLFGDAEGGDALWTEAWPAGGGDCLVDPTGCVVVAGGRFQVMLGAHAPLGLTTLASGPLWLSVSVEGEPPLPRRPLGSAPQAGYADVAGGLACSGCVDTDALSGAARDDLAAEALAAVEAAGYLSGVIDESALPASGLNEVSGGILSNERSEVYAAAGPTPIPDGFLAGVSSTVTVPSVGVAKGLTVSVQIANSDLSTLTVHLYDPLGGAYTLWDGDGPGTSLVATYPAPDAPLTGDLTLWHGQDPAGDWVLEIIDAGVLDGTTDGEITTWSVNVDAVATDHLDVHSDVTVDGDLTLLGRLRVGTSAATCDAGAAGAVHFDPVQRALFLCDGQDLVRLQACSSVCDAAADTPCGAPVTDGCATPCGGLGAGLNTEQCVAAVATTACGVGVVDGCDNDCALVGAGFDPAGCPDASEVACGGPVQDACGNFCGVGVFCPAGSCTGGVCLIGVSSDTAAQSCRQVAELNPQATDGTYWVDPDGDGANAFQVYCDQTTDGGGWTYVARGSSGGTQSDNAYGSIKLDPTQTGEWHLTGSQINQLAGPPPYESYVTMGLGGDSAAVEVGEYRVRRENAVMTFASAMFDYAGWSGSEWVSATAVGSGSDRGPSWEPGPANICCNRSAGGVWTSCDVAPQGSEGQWSNVNTNQHLRCLQDTTVHDGLILFVR